MNKKYLAYLTIFILLLSTILVFAEENSTPSLTDLSNAPEQIKEDLGKAKEDTITTFKENFASSLEIPEEISFLPKILFGIEDSLTLSELIIYSAIWVFILLILQNILSTIPFFEGKMTWIISITILLLMSITGGIKKGAIIWMTFLSSISFFENLDSWTMSILIILLIVIYLITTKLSKSIKESMKITKASAEGIKAGKGIAVAKITAKNLEDF